MSITYSTIKGLHINREKEKMKERTVEIARVEINEEQKD